MIDRCDMSGLVGNLVRVAAQRLWAVRSRAVDRLFAAAPLSSHVAWKEEGRRNRCADGPWIMAREDDMQ